jgi:hypothetical protein
MNAALLLIAAVAHAQWLSFPTPEVARTATGKPDLYAPAPRTSDGKPHLSGVWISHLGYTSNIANGLKPGAVPFQPSAEGLYEHRLETGGGEAPNACCVLSGVLREHVVPHPFLNSNKVIVIPYEALHNYCQIFMDGRALPKDPNSAWMGHSIGHWQDFGHIDLELTIDDSKACTRPWSVNLQFTRLPTPT